MIVRENINFERGIDPKQAMGTGLVKIIEDMGVRFHFNWDGGEIQKERYIKNIDKFYSLIEKLVKLGVKPIDMEISQGDEIEIRSYRVILHDHSLFHCLTEKDAWLTVNMLRKFAINRPYSKWLVEQGSGISGTTISINRDQTWLDELVENREKYNEISF